jgi:glucose uptake protein GlcU
LSAQIILGIVSGLVTAFFIGLFMVPRRYSKADSVTFMVGMTAGAAITNTSLWLAAGMPFEATWAALFSLVPGATWAVGSYAYASGTNRIGLAKATAIKNTQLVVTTGGGLLLFGEAATTNSLLAAAGGALVIATAVVLSRTEHREESVPNASLKGYLMPIAASIFYGVNGLFMKWLLEHKVPRPLIGLGIGIGALGAAIAIYAVVRRRVDFVPAASGSDHGLALLGGVTWAIGLVTMLMAIEYAGVAVGWSLMNLSIVVSVLYGVVILREIDFRRKWLQIGGGLALAFLGIAALTLAKVLPALSR